MDIINPQTEQINRGVPVHRSILLVCGLSLMIGLSGCSDGGETTRLATEGAADDTQDSSSNNQDNTNGGEGGSGDGDNSNGGDDTPADTSKLHVKFTRPAPVENSAPHIQRQNQELSGRQFQLAVYAIDDELNLQDVTTDVTWTTVAENCGGEPCYTLSPEGRLVAGAVGQFRVQAEYNGLLSHEVALETPRKLETCGVEGNADKAHRGKKCLHIIVGNSGDADGKWFTEPPRVSVMHHMWYSPDRTVYNSGYTYSRLFVDGGSGTNQFFVMRNDGYDEKVDTSRNVGGDYGQHDRYCRDLAMIRFNGRDNWRRPTQDELLELSTMSIGSTYDWPVNGYYASENVHIKSEANGGLHLRHVYMATSQVASKLPSTFSLPTCVSEQTMSS